MKTILCMVLFTLTNPTLSQEKAPYPPVPAYVSSIGTLVSDDEPGERLVVKGSIYKADGKTPYAGLVLYLYQTDATGVYNNTDRSWQRPRIHGWVKTDEKGRYEIHTIKPGSYPRSRNPAHIHAIVKLPGEEATWIDDFLFEGDTFLTERDRRNTKPGSFSSIMKCTADGDGVLQCVRDIVVH